MFYLFDLEYPLIHQAGLYILQWIIFKIQKVPQDLTQELDQVYGKDFIELKKKIC